VKLSKGLVIFLIFPIFFVSFTQIQVNAQNDTIYIRANGSVEGSDMIQPAGSIYIFTENIVNQSILVEKDSIVVDGAGYTLEGGHIWLENRRNVTIKNIEITRSDEGIRIMGNSINNSIIENKIYEIKTSTGNAIWIYLGASNNIISGNIISNNSVGIKVDMSGSTTISENYISSNEMGIWLSGSQNRIVRNEIINNGVGVNDFIGGNFIQHNNFVNNSVTLPESLIYTNVWDDGYPSGGNYWSNYNGTDNNSDGIGDTPYFIDENNQDNYPFVNPIDIETIPEFSSWTQLILLSFAVVVLIVVYKRSVLKTNQRSDYQ
jgi:parallel beta-helix repeat protein